MITKRDSDESISNVWGIVLTRANTKNSWLKRSNSRSRSNKWRNYRFKMSTRALSTTNWETRETIYPLTNTTPLITPKEICLMQACKIICPSRLNNRIISAHHYNLMLIRTDTITLLTKDQRGQFQGWSSWTTIWNSRELAIWMEQIQGPRKRGSTILMSMCTRLRGKSS